VRIGFAVAQRHDALPFKLTERVVRYRPKRRRASICQEFLRQAPALQCPQ